MNKRRYGIIGEKIAQSYLINKDYEIIETNYYTKRWEIDIICQNIDYTIAKTGQMMYYVVGGINLCIEKILLQ